MLALVPPPRPLQIPAPFPLHVNATRRGRYRFCARAQILCRAPTQICARAQKRRGPFVDRERWHGGIWRDAQVIYDFSPGPWEYGTLYSQSSLAAGRVCVCKLCTDVVWVTLVSSLFLSPDIYRSMDPHAACNSAIACKMQRFRVDSGDDCVLPRLSHSSSSRGARVASRVGRARP